MNIWRIVGQIASGFGIIFIVFAVLSAFITYEAITLQSGIVPAGYLQVNLLNAMLPYLLYTVLSFIVAGVIMRASKDNIQQEAPSAETEPQPAATQPEETKP